MPAVNRQITLAARPAGLPRISDFQLDYAALPSPGPGQALVRCQYLALDPHLRPRMSALAASGPLALGEVIPGAAIGEVVRSEDPGLLAGDVVEGMLGWQEHAVASAAELRKIERGGAPATAALGALGLPGLAAYFGMLDVGRPRRGETAVVSGASGAIGMFAGQVASLRRCRVVGLVRGEDDASWLRDELGFDEVIAYESAVGLGARLGETCSGGIDIYFDNEGGAATDEVVRRINAGARLALCGQSSLDNLEEPEPGPRWLDRLIASRARAEGFQVASYGERFSSARAQLTRWLAAGKLSYREHVAQGLEAAPQAFIAMLRGAAPGSQLVRLRQ